LIHVTFKCKHYLNVLCKKVMHYSQSVFVA